MTTWLKQSTAATVKLGPFVDSTDGATAKTGLTIAQADIRLTKNGAAFAQTNNSAGATHDENGYYGVPLDTTDTATLGRLRVAVNKATALPVWEDFLVIAANVFDSLIGGGDVLDVSTIQFNGSAVIQSGGRPEVNVTHLLGTAWLTPGTAGTPDVNVKLWNGLTTVALPLVPTTAGRTLDVSAGGEAGVDWANVGTPTTVLALTGTTIAVTQKVDVETIKTQAVTASAGVTFPTSIASPTNITAGTITTATNLTNAPTAGDFTATMKTSLNAATPVVTVSDKTGFSLSSAGVQAVWDALTSALTTVGSIGKLLVDNINATISSRMATFVYTAPLDAAGTRAAVGLATANLDTQIDALPTAAESADAVWDELIAGHAISGSTGEALANAGGAGTPPTVGAIADAVWDEARAGHVAAGSFGEGVSSVQGNVTGSVASVSGAVGSVTGNVGGNVAGSVASVTADVGITQTGADKVWASAARTLTSFGTLVADVATAVWGAATRILTAGTNIALAKGTGVTGFNDLSAAQVNAEADTALADVGVTATVTGRVDVAVSTRLATAGYTAPDNAGIATAVAGAAAIFARTDVATSTRLAASSYVAPDNADILLIKAQTDLLPASPAATGDIPTAAENADKLLGRNIAGGSDGGRMVKDAVRPLRNRTRINGGVLSVYEEDDTTVAWSGPVTTAPGDPLVEINPA